MRAYLFFTKGESSQAAAERLTEVLTKDRVEVINLDADSIDGDRLTALYDITQRPAVVVPRDDGQMVHRWLGHLPAAGDISYYVHG